MCSCHVSVFTTTVCYYKKRTWWNTKDDLCHRVCKAAPAKREFYSFAKVEFLDSYQFHKLENGYCSLQRSSYFRSYNKFTPFKLEHRELSNILQKIQILVSYLLTLTIDGSSDLLVTNSDTIKDRKSFVYCYSIHVRHWWPYHVTKTINRPKSHDIVLTETLQAKKRQINLFNDSIFLHGN